MYSHSYGNRVLEDVILKVSENECLTMYDKEEYIDTTTNTAIKLKQNSRVALPITSRGSKKVSGGCSYTGEGIHYDQTPSGKVGYKYAVVTDEYVIEIRRIKVDVHKGKVSLPDLTSTDQVYGHKASIGTFTWKKAGHTCKDSYEEAFFGEGYSNKDNPAIGTLVKINNTNNNILTAHKLVAQKSVCGFPGFSTNFENIDIYIPSYKSQR